MSDLKYQLRKLLPTLSSQQIPSNDQAAKARWQQIRAIIRSSKDIAKACRHEGRSTEWFYHWAKRLLKAKSLKGICTGSRRPERCPKQTPKRVVKRIKKLREVEPFAGCERISQDLKDFYNIDCPPRTVHNVLVREGLVSPDRQKALTKRHLKRYRRPSPGYLQMDFKYVPYLMQGGQYYQLSVVDHHSSWRLIRNYRTKCALSVMAFIEELRSQCPFPIIQIQTDNDSAFTDKFTSQHGIAETGNHLMDRWCRKHGIEHRLIPPGQKELNGKVENTHKQDDREHFSRLTAVSFEGLRLATIVYNERWNGRRRTKALGWKTPLETIWEAYIRIVAWMLVLARRYHPNEQQLVQLSRNDVCFIPIPQAHRPKGRGRTRKQSHTSRYLQWLDWDGKKGRKA